MPDRSWPRRRQAKCGALSPFAGPIRRWRGHGLRLGVQPRRHRALHGAPAQRRRECATPSQRRGQPAAQRHPETRRPRSGAHGRPRNPDARIGRLPAGFQRQRNGRARSAGRVRRGGRTQARTAQGQPSRRRHSAIAGPDEFGRGGAAQIQVTRAEYIASRGVVCLRGVVGLSGKPKIEAVSRAGEQSCRLREEGLASPARRRRCRRNGHAPGRLRIRKGRSARIAGRPAHPRARNGRPKLFARSHPRVTDVQYFRVLDFEFDEKWSLLWIRGAFTDPSFRPKASTSIATRTRRGAVTGIKQLVAGNPVAGWRVETFIESGCARATNFASSRASPAA